MFQNIIAGRVHMCSNKGVVDALVLLRGFIDGGDGRQLVYGVGGVRSTS
jgi:hypothetical protein